MQPLAVLDKIPVAFLRDHVYVVHMPTDRTPKRRSEETAIATIRVPVRLLAAIDAKAEAERRTRNYVINELLEDAVARLT